MKDKTRKTKGIPNGILINGITNLSSTRYYFQQRLTKKAPNLSSTKCFGALLNMWR